MDISQDRGADYEGILLFGDFIGIPYFRKHPYQHWKILRRMKARVPCGAWGRDMPHSKDQGVSRTVSGG